MDYILKKLGGLCISYNIYKICRGKKILVGIENPSCGVGKIQKEKKTGVKKIKQASPYFSWQVGLRYSEKLLTQAVE
ncbi:hypothetical protein [Parasphingorhabdus sp.]